MIIKPMACSSMKDRDKKILYDITRHIMILHDTNLHYTKFHNMRTGDKDRD